MLDTNRLDGNRTDFNYFRCQRCEILFRTIRFLFRPLPFFAFNMWQNEYLICRIIFDIMVFRYVQPSFIYYVFNFILILVFVRCQDRDVHRVGNFYRCNNLMSRLPTFRR